MNVNMLRDQDDDAGFWTAVANSSATATFAGAALFVSPDGSTPYTKTYSVSTDPAYTHAVNFTVEATIGYATNALGDFAGGNIPDELNSLNVVLYDGSLSSTDYAGLLSGTNTLIVGDEIIYFRTATLQTDGSYTITGMLRGRRGSEYAMPLHAVNDRVILFDSAKLVRVPQVNADIGIPKLFKAVPALSSIGAVGPKSFTNIGAPLKTHAPSHLGGGKEANGDWTLNWIRHGRKDFAWRNYVDVPLGESVEAYSVEIYTSSTFAALKRTISTTSQTATYTAAQQTSDFGSGQSEVYFVVRQVSAAVGPGYPAYGHVVASGVAAPVYAPPPPTPAPPPDPAPAPGPAPAPSPVPPYSGGPIAVFDLPNTFLQTTTGPNGEAYWINDGVWGAGNLVRGTYTGLTGTQYEQYIGVSPDLGPNGEVACRLVWKWPYGTTEVKSYPGIIYGNKPGFYNPWTTPGGNQILLPDGTYSTVYPSGPTPGTLMPRQLPLAPWYSTFNYKHLSAPTGEGHLSYDIWLQNTSTQYQGFGQGITHEIMIPVNNWGGYGDWHTRNPSWNTGLTVTINGILFHVFYAPNFNGVWKFIVFQPDNFADITPGMTFNLATFVNYVATQGWATGNEWMVEPEFGVEPHFGTGDLVIHGYREFP